MGVNEAAGLGGNRQTALVRKHYTVVFSANFLAYVQATSEEEARKFATVQAERAANEFGNMTVQGDDDIAIHADDIVRVEEGDEVEWDPYEHYGTPEHEAWLVEMERQEG